MIEIKGNNENARIPVGATVRCRKYVCLVVFCYFARQIRPDCLSEIHYGLPEFDETYTLNKLIYFLGTDIMCLCFAYAVFSILPKDRLFAWVKAIFWIQVAFQIFTPYANPVFSNDWFKVHFGEWVVMGACFIGIFCKTENAAK